MRERIKKFELSPLRLHQSTYLTHQMDQYSHIDKQRVMIRSYSEMHDIYNYRKELKVAPEPSKPNY